MINTERIFREGELDKGFILRANDQVARQLREMINQAKPEENAQRNLEIFLILPERRLYG